MDVIRPIGALVYSQCVAESLTSHRVTTSTTSPFNDLQCLLAWLAQAFPGVHLRKTTILTCSKHKISLLSGPTVKVVWGVDDRTAVVPEALLRSCHSPSLDTSLKQVWIKGQDRTIDWKNQDGPTIERFVTWLYRGDYNTPRPRPRSPTGSPSPNHQGKGGQEKQENNMNDSRAEEPSNSEPASEPAFEIVAEPEPDISQETEQAVGQHPDEWFQEDSRAMEHVVAESCNGRPLTPISSCLALGLPEERQTTEAGIFAHESFAYNSHCYNEVLLAHAHLYTFALYHQIKALQDFSLQRLTQVLMRINCRQSHAASEIAALIQHIYRDTLPAVYSKDAARQLVSQFAAINFDELVHGEFETLLEEGGDFVLDVSRKVSQRLRSARDCTEGLESEVRRLKEDLQQLKFPVFTPVPLVCSTSAKKKNRW